MYDCQPRAGLSNGQLACQQMAPWTADSREDKVERSTYPTPVELVGGAVDGEVVAPGFTLDVEELRAAFDRIEALVWHSLGFPHDEGPRLVVEGVLQGRKVFLQVLAYAPEDEEPGMRLDTSPSNH